LKSAVLPQFGTPTSATRSGGDATATSMAATR
jgi:hypothetical protein